MAHYQSRGSPGIYSRASIFFIICINDIVTEIHSSIKLFADDTSLYVIFNNPRESATMLNKDMATIHAWSTKWLVNFNPKKTETMMITRKINKPFHPVTEHKHLGLEISNDGSWQKHIDLIAKKAFTRVNILRKFKFILDRKTLEQICLTFIRPILEYADFVWDNKTVFLINKLENVQIEAARIVTGGTRLVSINSLYKETGWARYRRDGNTTKIDFDKMVNGLVLPYLSVMVPWNFENIHDYNTRQAVSIPQYVLEQLCTITIFYPLL